MARCRTFRKIAVENVSYAAKGGGAEIFCEKLLGRVFSDFNIFVRGVRCWAAAQGFCGVLLPEAGGGFDAAAAFNKKRAACVLPGGEVAHKKDFFF